MRISDWSSDVCSSDLQKPLRKSAVENVRADLAHLYAALAPAWRNVVRVEKERVGSAFLPALLTGDAGGRYSSAPVLRLRPHSSGLRIGELPGLVRAEERRGGREWVGTCGSGWSALHKKTNSQI